MVGIYKITNIVNNQSYIGQSIHIEARWQEHIRRAINEKNPTKKLYIAMREYGIDQFVFEVLEECALDQQVLDEREKYWIEYYNSFNNGYNSTRGGQGHNAYLFNPEQIQQLWDDGYTTSEIAKIVGCNHSTVNKRLQGYKDYNTYTSHQRGAGSLDLNLKKAILNKKYYISSKEQQLYFAEAVEVHQYGLDGTYIASYPSQAAAVRAIGKNYNGSSAGITHAISEDPADKRRTAFGFQWSREKVEKMPPAPVPNGKLVCCIETGQIFPSTVEAAKWCGLKSKSNIRECCVGIGKSAGKHPITGEKLHWKYVE